jgi:hypothetical protein
MVKGVYVVSAIIFVLVVFGGYLAFNHFLDYEYIELDIDPNSIYVNVNQTSVDLNVFLSSDSQSIDSVISIISNGSDSYEDRVDVLISPSQKKSLSFSYGGLSDDSLESITLVPLSQGKEGESVLGMLSKTYNFKTNEIEEVETESLLEDSVSLSEVVQSGGVVQTSGGGGGSAVSNIVESVTQFFISDEETSNETSDEEIYEDILENDSLNVSDSQNVSENVPQNNITIDLDEVVVDNEVRRVVIDVSKDTGLIASSPNSGYYEQGSSPSFDYRFNNRVGLYYFDLSSIPNNAIIEEAILSVHSVGFNQFDRAGSVPIYLVQRLSPNNNVEWVEGSGKESYSQYGGTSWVAKSNVSGKKPTLAWSTNSGRNVNGDLFSAYHPNLAGSMDFKKELGQQNSSDLSSSVQLIVDLNGKYEGFALDMYGRENKIRKDRIATKEYSDKSKIPQLYVSYTLGDSSNENVSNIGFVSPLPYQTIYDLIEIEISFNGDYSYNEFYFDNVKLYSGSSKTLSYDVSGFKEGEHIVGAVVYSPQGIVANASIIVNLSHSTVYSDGSLTKIIFASKDTGLIASSPNSGYYEQGSSPSFDYRFNNRVGLYYFDLSSIPKGSVITGAEIKLYSVGNGEFDKAGSVPIYLVQTLPPNKNINWVEGSGEESYSQYGGTSWLAKTDLRTEDGGYLERPKYIWSNKQGRYNKGDLFSAYSNSVGGMNFVENKGEQSSDDVSQAIRDIISKNGYSYEGFALDMQGREGQVRKDSIATKEYSDESKHPRLIVRYKA